MHKFLGLSKKGVTKPHRMLSSIYSNLCIHENEVPSSNYFSNNNTAQHYLALTSHSVSCILQFRFIHHRDNLGY
jgi:hypothetical protein